MKKMPLHTANVVGSGPNGLAAAITLAQHGVAVTVYERSAQLGGACSTAEITLPGFRHDLGSSCYPLGVASPFFCSLPLEEYGLRWIEPPAPLAHPLDDGTAVLLEHDLEETAAQFDAHDSRAWRSLLGPSVRDWRQLVEAATQPWVGLPRRLDTMVGFGSVAVFPARMLARAVFHSEPARAIFAGCAAHAVLPLTRVASSATGLLMATAAQTTGWPIAAGGAQSITDALAAYLASLGGEVVLNAEISDVRELVEADVTLFDTSVDALLRLTGSALTPSFQERLRSFRRGPGIFKMDFALREPIPWKAPACTRAATVHLGGSMDEIALSEHDAFYGRHNDNPFMIVVQPSLFDPTRAPLSASGQPQHTAWAYCHVPAGSTEDLTDVLERQIERFAPGFHECVLARRASGSHELAAWNPNLVGGDVSGGAMTLTQLLLRPTARLYRTSNANLYLCSSSTPPGGGVHGMCGHLAARAALKDHQR
jgi:phytoene dehydrogenase-like protein